MNATSMTKGYKPSALEYTEIVLLVICLLMHFVSWASISVNGEQIVSFGPFTLFGTSFILAVCAMFLFTVAMKFVGRFSGMTLLVVAHMTIFVYAAHTAYMQGQELLKYARGFADFSGMLGAGRTSSAVEAVQATSMTGLYMFVGVFVGLLVITLLISWIVAACRLASKPRNRLTYGYYVGILGYLVVCVITAFVALFAYDSVKHAQSLHHLLDSIIFIYAVLAFCVLLFMLIVNAIVVGLVELLRERDNVKMMWWSLALAGVFFVLWLMLAQTNSEIDYFSFRDIRSLLNYQLEELMVMTAKVLARSFTLVAILTCLLRALYFGVFERKCNAVAIDETAPSSEPADEPATELVTEHSNEMESEPIDEANGESSIVPADRQKWYYIAFASVVAVAIGLWLCCKGENDNLLNVPKPQWEKFVMVTADDVSVYKDPSEDSPKLMEAMENIESDMCDIQFRWSDQGKMRGYTVSDYSLASKTVVPVLEEIGDWYKVQVESEFIGQTEAYINKKWCQEVKPQPITEEVLEHLGKVSGRCDYLVKKGKLKGLCFSTSFQDMDGEAFEIGQLTGDALIYPEARQVFLSTGDSEGISFTKNEDYDNYTLIYVEGRSVQVNDYAAVFDTRTLTEAEMEEIYNAIKLDHPEFFRVMYYFPEADATRLFSFTYHKNGLTIVGNAKDDQVEEGVSNYRLSEEDGMQRLMADLDGTETFAGVENTFIELIHEQDFDDDGCNEVLITESCGGSSCMQEVSIVYYDKDAKMFKKTNCCESSANPLLEMWNDRMSIVQRYGIRQDRYVYDDHQLKQVESTIQESGKPMVKWLCSNIFDEDFEGEKEVMADIDGDGTDETLVFGHDLSHASGFGKYMSLNKITWSDGRTAGENENLGIFSADVFVLLNSLTNGMCDVLVGNAYLFRWNGSQYEEWIWDGRQIVKKDRN